MKISIIDSSVVFKWFSKDEVDRDLAVKLLNDHISQKIQLMVPDLIFYEIANAWATKSALSATEVEINLSKLEEANLKVEQIDFKFIKQAVMFSKKYQVSVYDSIYAVMAEEKKCDLITADDKFADKVNLPFVKKLSAKDELRG